MHSKETRKRGIWALIQEAGNMRSVGIAEGTRLHAVHGNKRMGKLKAPKKKR